jgi:hypothetical protein
MASRASKALENSPAVSSNRGQYSLLHCERLFAIYQGVLNTIERNDETTSTAPNEALAGDTSELIPHRLVVIADESMVLDAANLMNIDDEELLDALLGD